MAAQFPKSQGKLERLVAAGNGQVGVSPESRDLCWSVLMPKKRMGSPSVIPSQLPSTNIIYSPDLPEFRLLQPIWDLRIGYEDWLQSPVFPVIISVSFYFILCLPFVTADILCNQMDWYKKYKIQPDKEVTAAMMFDTLSLTFWNNLLFIMPAALTQWVWVPATPIPVMAPTVFEFICQQIASLVIFDLQYYVWHLTHHKVRFLYKTIHSVHHHYHSSFVWVTMYVHPWELVTTGLLVTTNMWFFDAHPMTIWSYMIVTVAMSVEDHIGFDFPFLPHHWDPTGLIGGSPKHDMHHLKPLTNFQPLFNHWDKMFGSYCPVMSGGGMKSQALQDYETRIKDEKKCV